MNERIGKLMIECNELIVRFNKLGSFMDTKEYDALDNAMKGFIIEQHQSMLNYKWALRDRIEYMEEI